MLIRDISRGGLLIESETAELSVGDEINLELPERGLVRAGVAWRSGPFFGCQFSQLVAPAVISAALLKADAKDAKEAHIAPGSRTRFGIGPELNFSTAFLLALVLWGLIGLTAYITVVL